MADGRNETIRNIRNYCSTPDQNKKPRGAPSAARLGDGEGLTVRNRIASVVTYSAYNDAADRDLEADSNKFLEDFHGFGAFDPSQLKKILVLPFFAQ